MGGGRDRSLRLLRLLIRLTDAPDTPFSLSAFAREQGVNKATVSEDLRLVEEALSGEGKGTLAGRSGPKGGIRFLPALSPTGLRQLAQRLSGLLADPDRILPGGYLYMTDLIFHPAVVMSIGKAFAGSFRARYPEVVVTIETKGIPLTLATAHALGIPMVTLGNPRRGMTLGNPRRGMTLGNPRRELTVRKDSRLTEGSTVSLPYVSGSRRIRTMSLPRRSLPTGGRVRIIDDFMKAGATIRGLAELMGEFQAEVVGVGVLVATREPVRRKLPPTLSLLEMGTVDEEGQRVEIAPAPAVAAEGEPDPGKGKGGGRGPWESRQ